MSTTADQIKSLQEQIAKLQNQQVLQNQQAPEGSTKEQEPAPVVKAPKPDRNATNVYESDPITSDEVNTGNLKITMQVKWSSHYSPIYLVMSLGEKEIMTQYVNQNCLILCVQKLCRSALTTEELAKIFVNNSCFKYENGALVPVSCADDEFIFSAVPLDPSKILSFIKSCDFVDVKRTGVDELVVSENSSEFCLKFGKIFSDASDLTIKPVGNHRALMNLTQTLSNEKNWGDLQDYDWEDSNGRVWHLCQVTLSGKQWVYLMDNQWNHICYLTVAQLTKIVPDLKLRILDQMANQEA